MNNGLNAGEDYGELLCRFEEDNDPGGQCFRIVDLTSAVQQWADGTPSYGFAILPEVLFGRDDGIEIWSSEAWKVLLRSAFDIEFIRVGGLAMVSGPASVTLLVLGGAFLLNANRRRRRTESGQVRRSAVDHSLA
ncbi:MAG: hypothetical protein ACOC0P_03530 [Planctomycetota bacterium]